jgi:hypothetical protein
MELRDKSVLDLYINGAPAIDSLKVLDDKIDGLKARQKELKKELEMKDLDPARREQLINEYRELSDEIKNTTREKEQLRKEMNLEELSIKELKNLLKDYRKAWQEATDPAIREEIKKKMDTVSERMDEVTGKVNASKGVWGNMKDWITGALGAFTVVNILTAIVDFTRESLTMAAKISDAFADIRKVTGMTTKEVEALNSEIQKIDTRTAQESLLDIAKVGGAIGVANQEMLGFVKSTDMAVVALGDEFTGGAEEVAQKMGTLKTLFKETKDLDAGTAINQIGSAINELGAAGTATGPVIAEFTTRMGQLGDLSPQISETMGLGAAFQELGLTAEISAGGLSNILLTASKSTASFADHLGMTEQAFKNLINTNPNEVILQLARSFKGMPVDEVVKQLDNLDIKSQEATKVMTLLSDQTEKVREKQELASKAMKEGTSLTNEFNIKNTTAAAELEKATKALDQQKLALGMALLPALVNVTTAFVAFIKIVGAVPEFIRENKEMFIALGTAIVAFNGHLILATATSLAHAAAEKARLIWTESATVAQWAMNTALTANPIGAVVAAVALLVGGLITLYKNFEGVRNVIDGVWDYLKRAGNALGNFFGILGDEHAKSLSQQKAANQKHLDDKAASEKKTAAQIAADAEAANQKALADKAKAEQAARAAQANAEKAAKNAELAAKAAENEKHRKAELEKAKKAAEKAAEDAIKAEKDALKAIEDARVKAIADDQQREIARLKLSHTRQLENIADSKASQTTKAAWEKALTEQLERDIAAVEKTHRDKKLADDKKRIEETTKLEEAARVERQNREYSTSKAIIENALSNERLSIAERKSLKLQLIDLEHRQELARIEDVAQKERHKARETSAQLMKLAGDDDAKKRQITNDLDATIRGIDAQLLADKTAANNKHNADTKAAEQKSLEERKANQQEFFNAIKSLLNGDFNGFMDFLDKKLSNEKAMNNERLQSWTTKGQEILSGVGMAVEALQALNQKYLDSQIDKNNKERDDKIKKLQQQYQKGLIDKGQYETGIKNINEQADAQEKALKLKAWKRDQAAQIAMAIINAASAALKSLATMGWPLGLVGVAASAAIAIAQTSMIKKQQPPSFAQGGKLRNGGVPDGPRHGSEYGKSGIALVDRETGEEKGEMEGGEPIMILSRNTYKNNGRLIDKLLTSSLHRNGAPVFAEKGSVFGSDGGSYQDYLQPLQGGQMYLFGSKKRKAYDAKMQAQYDADMAAKADMESYQNMDYGDNSYDPGADGGYDTGGGFDSGVDFGGGGDFDFDYDDGSGATGDASATVSATNAQIQQSQQTMNTIGRNTAATVSMLKEVKASIDGVNSRIGEAVGVLHSIENWSRENAQKPPVSITQVTQIQERTTENGQKSTFG